MTRTGWTILALLLLAGIAVALSVRITGPGTPSPEPASVASVAAAPAVARPAGALIVPVRGVARGALTDSWGDPRGGEGARAHKGIDVMAPAGTPVIAAADGRVEKLFTSEDGGLTIYQRTAAGDTVLYYAHLAAYAAGLAEGQAVRAGDALGTVGATGDADAAAPHLHFEVHRMAPGQHWWEGTEVDPYPLLTH